jgi:hypothetical protein
MPHYRVHLKGSNFRFTIGRKPVKLGFLTARVLEASGKSEAELGAVQLIREDRALAGVRNKRSDPPMIYCEAIEPLRRKVASARDTGFIFYPEDDGTAKIISSEVDGRKKPAVKRRAKRRAAN